MNYEKYIKYAMIILLVIACIFLFPIFIKFFLPFILAFMVATSCQKILTFLNKKLKINRGISTALIITFFVAFISWVLFLLFSHLFVQAKSFIEFLPETIEKIKNTFYNLGDKYNELYLGFSPKFREFFDSFNIQFSEYLKSAITPVATGVLGAVKNFAVSLPDFVIFFFIFLLSTFFITKDYELIKKFYHENFSIKIRTKIYHFKTTVFSALLTYIKAQLILMTITFTVVSVSLLIIGADYPFVMGVIIGIVDALPFLGTAIILVPWTIFSLLSGRYMFALGLVITQIIAFITRQLLEPKIVSSQIGIHPLITLISVYVGLNIFGILGIILGPIIALLIVNTFVASKPKGH